MDHEAKMYSIFAILIHYPYLVNIAQMWYDFDIRKKSVKRNTVSTKVRINENIMAPELRVMDQDGGNLGIISREAAIEQARDAGLDLIEISPKATPPVAKITDYGKFQYEQKKKQREIKAKSHITETKTVQVKIGTGDHDLNLKAKRVANWLGGGHRVRIDLFLWGRYKYMEQSFLKERLERFLKLIPENYKIADEIKKSPKGMTVTVERDKASNKSAAAEEPKKESEPKEQPKKTDNENK